MEYPHKETFRRNQTIGVLAVPLIVVSEYIDWTIFEAMTWLLTIDNPGDAVGDSLAIDILTRPDLVNPWEVVTSMATVLGNAANDYPERKSFYRGISGWWGGLIAARFTTAGSTPNFVGVSLIVEAK